MVPRDGTAEVFGYQRLNKKLDAQADRPELFLTNSKVTSAIAAG
jgi:hypothetical protein